MELFDQIIRTQDHLHTRPSTTVLCVWVLLCPLLAFVLLAGATGFVTVATTALLGCLLTHRRIRLSTRSLAYAVTLVGLTVVIGREFWPIDDEHFFMPAGVAFPLLIGLGIAACYFVQHHAVLITVAVCGLLAMMVEGSTLKDPDVARLGLATMPWGNRFWVFGLALSGQVLALLPLLTRAQGDRRPAEVPSLHGWGPWSWRAAAFLLLAGLTVVTCVGVNRGYKHLDTFFSPVLEAYIRRGGSQAYFSNKVDLRETLDLKDTARSAKIVARVKGAIPPGYLRARAYFKYEGGVWYSQEQGPGMVQISGDSGLSAKTFAYPELVGGTPLDRLPQIHIFPTSHFPANALLASGNMVAIELIADRVMADRDGSLRPKDWDGSGGYSYRVPRIIQDEAYPLPGADTLLGTSDYLDLPDAIWVDLQLAAEEIFYACPPDSESRIRRAADYLRNNFEYTLEFRGGGPGTDPVIHFLTKGRAGHCELFAASTVLMLRTQGIPARYITGFFCTESHPESNYWMTRLGDSHAWAEAWCEKRQKWVTVESTPASGIPQGERRSSALAFFWEFPIVLWNEIFSYVKRGHFAEAVKAFVMGVVTFLYWVFYAGPWFVGWGLLALALGLLSLLAARRHQRRFHADAPALRPLHRCLTRLERQWRRRGLKREANTTLRDLATQLRERQAAIDLALADLLLEYECLRYRQPPASPERVADLLQRASNLGRAPARPPPEAPP